jgi:hypothetical protein
MPPHSPMKGAGVIPLVRLHPEYREGLLLMEIVRMLGLPAAVARLHHGASVLCVLALVTPVPPAVAQPYSPPTYANPDQMPGYPSAPPPGYPGGVSPAYPSQGYGGPGAPPPPQQEAVPPPPSAAMVWQPGYWNWSRHGWVWVFGRYVARPYPRANWIPGHWTQRHGGWVWVPGRWR